jgi:hypothetical protein
MAAHALDAILELRRDMARERAAELAAWQRSRQRKCWRIPRSIKPPRFPP